MLPLVPGPSAFPRQVTEAMVRRLHADEAAVEAYFSTFLKPDRLAKVIQQLSDIRELLSSQEWVQGVLGAGGSGGVSGAKERGTSTGAVQRA